MGKTLKERVEMEDRISRNLMWLNEQRISKNELLRRKSIKLILNYFKRIFRYICMGKFGYAKYAIKRAFSVMSRDEKVDNTAKPKRMIDDQERIAVYTVLFGKYDELKEPMYISPQCDYYVLTDQDIYDGGVWKRYPISRFDDRVGDLSDLERARFFKLHPHFLFPEYRYSVFVDANIQIVTDIVPVVRQLGDNFIAIHNQPGRDCVYQEATEILVLNKAPWDQVKKQIDAYKKEGFPEHYGLFRTCVIVREHMDPRCIKLMGLWWENIEKYSKRDQLSFTYSLWKMKLDKNAVSNLGYDIRRNPRFLENKHVKQ